jgi:alpha-L-rhamnosidase
MHSSPIHRFLLATLLLETSWAAPSAPDGLMIELLSHAETTVIRDAAPEFSWVVNDPSRAAVQSAWQILVESTDPATEPVWDSGKVASSESINVAYQGKPLLPGKNHAWRVKTWDAAGNESPWSKPQHFKTADHVSTRHELAPASRANVDFTNRHRLITTDDAPARVVDRGDGNWFIDFGKAAFGNLIIRWDHAPNATLNVGLGEMLTSADRIESKPPGTVRYQKTLLKLEPGTTEHAAKLSWAPPGWMREGFLGLPPEFGQVMPFRYAEIEGAPADFKPEHVLRRSLSAPFDTTASSFHSSSPDLNALWDFCKYTIQATTFMGIYVDGDRERKPYEADAFLNQVSHYAVDREYSTARHSHEFLLQRPTWPLEWQHHSVLMAWEDYFHTGNSESLAANYEILSAKTLKSLAREDGLIVDEAGKQTREFLASINMTEPLKTIVDWPAGERDGHRITPVDSVANAFHYRTLILMKRIAEALDRKEDATTWQGRAEKVRKSYHSVFFDSKNGHYRDGEGVAHSSQHANLFPLVFGLVPQDQRATILSKVKSRGMACSVYVSQFLMDALYENGEQEHALKLLESKELRSWHNMIAKGSTLAMEAWDQSLKPNQDWNHAWGAAPANLIPRHLVGVRPLVPGSSRIIVQPQSAGLAEFEAKVPSIRGPIHVTWRRKSGLSALRVTIPANTTAEIHLPSKRPAAITEGGKPLREVPDLKPLRHENGAAVIEVGGGTYQFLAPD